MIGPSLFWKCLNIHWHTPNFVLLRALRDSSFRKKLTAVLSLRAASRSLLKSVLFRKDRSLIRFSCCHCEGGCSESGSELFHLKCCNKCRLGCLRDSLRSMGRSLLLGRSNPTTIFLPSDPPTLRPNAQFYRTYAEPPYFVVAIS